jgi:hypothetical protein
VAGLMGEANSQAYEIHFKGSPSTFATKLQRRLTDSIAGL